MRRLGWKDSKMLHRVYGHPFPNHDAELVDGLENRLQAARAGAGENVVRLRNRW